MNSFHLYILLTPLILIIFTNHLLAAPFHLNKISLGVRAGKSVNIEIDDFKSLEIFSDYNYPWQSEFIPGFILHTKTSMSAGVLEQDNDNELLTTLSQLIVLANETNEISFDLGGGVALVGDDRIGNHNFGTMFQFNYNIGITLIDLFNDISAGYRWFHLSDGGIGDGQGLNRHILELRYDF